MNGLLLNLRRAYIEELRQAFIAGHISLREYVAELTSLGYRKESGSSKAVPRDD